MTEQKPRRPKGTGSIYEWGGVVIGQYEVQTPSLGVDGCVRFAPGKRVSQESGGPGVFF
jgi:hypothetical protein